MQLLLVNPNTSAAMTATIAAAAPPRPPWGDTRGVMVCGFKAGPASVKVEVGWLAGEHAAGSAQGELTDARQGPVLPA